MSYRMRGGGSKGKLLYICRDCGKRTFINTFYTNRQGGARCMSCGGVVDPSSENAVNKRRKAVEVLGERYAGKVETGK